MNYSEAIERAGSIRAAAKLLTSEGFPVSEKTIRRWRSKTSDYEVELPEQPLTFDRVFAERVEKYSRKKDYEEGSKDISVKLKSNLPIGIGHMGDPHVDDDGTDVAKLFGHVDLFNPKQNPGLYAACLGDLWNNWAGRLSRLWAEQSTSAAEAKILVEELLTRTKWLYFVQGNHDCHDFETEALTRRGWLKYDDIRDDDEVLTLDPLTQEVRWNSIRSRFSRENTDRMISIESRTISLMVTPNHRVLHRNLRHTVAPLEYTTASKLPATFALPVAGLKNTSSCFLSDDQIALTGWILTDGSILNYGKGRPRIVIYQSKYPEVIEKLLDRLGYKYSKISRDRDITHVCGVKLNKTPMTSYEYHLGVDVSEQILDYCPRREQLPEWTHDIDDRQFNILLEALIAGDGTWTKTKEAAVLHKTKEFLSSVQAVAVQHGWRAMLSVAREKEYRLNLCRTLEWQAHRSVVVKEAPPSGKVWCLTVDQGNFMIRRNGKTHFSGNCWSGYSNILDYILNAKTNINAKMEQTITLEFPNGKTCRIKARHRFPGSSMYLSNFGQVKDAFKNGTCDIYIGGDRHVSGYSTGWHSGQKKQWHAVQVASYKYYDRYAIENGFDDKNMFVCPVSIIDPEASDPVNFIRWEFDPHEGAERLKWERSRRA